MSIEKLTKAVINCSKAKNWADGKKEFDIVKHYQVNNNTIENCECGHPIKEVFVIENRYNKCVLKVGSTCINKFEEKRLDDYLKNNAELKKLLKKETNLINKQIKVGIPPSVYSRDLNITFELGLINDYQYKFYNDIYKKTKLSDKQFKFKKNINDIIKMYMELENEEEEEEEEE